MMQHKRKSGSSISNIPYFQGTARKVDLRTDLGNITRTEKIWLTNDSRSYVNNSQTLTFRVELTDTSGNLTGSKQVTLEGEKIFGIICDGDAVEVIGEEGISGIYNPCRILNLTTGTEITTNRSLKKSNSDGAVWLFISGLLLTILVAATLGPVLGGLMFVLVLVIAFVSAFSRS